MSTKFISFIFRHGMPLRSISAMRLAGRLVTSMRTVFFPFRIHPLQSSVKGSAHAQPMYVPLMNTLALSRTSPRSIVQCPLACFLVSLTVVSYTPVPIVRAVSVSSLSHVCSESSLYVCPTRGASSAKERSHVLLCRLIVSATSPAALFWHTSMVSLSPVSVLYVCSIPDSPLLSLMRMLSPFRLTALAVPSIGLNHRAPLGATASSTVVSISSGVRLAMK